MSKSDAAMKSLLDGIGDKGQLKRFRFIESNSQEHNEWAENGLSFGINGIMYGACDFAWYTDAEWKDPFNGVVIKKKPVLVVEATDCLNTKSWGSAQIQRFHHALGPFLCNVNSIYYLNKGPNAVSLRPYLAGSAYFITKYYRDRGHKAAYMIITDINEVKELVEIIAKFGEDSSKCKQKIDTILSNMLEYFNKTFKSEKFNGNWMKYLESREIIKCADGKWIKDIGARSDSFTEGSQRYGHIVVGEVVTSKWLLWASGFFNPDKETLYYLFPLMTSKEIAALDSTKKVDKEWHILRDSDKSWKLLGIDDLNGVPTSIMDKINTYRTSNLNKAKGWEETKKKIRVGLRTGAITIK